jgi:exonuclease III
VERRNSKREGYKIIYSGRTNKRNGIGVIFDEKMKSKVVDVGRKIDRNIMVKLVFEKKLLNVISTYRQVEYEEREKEEFLREIKKIMQEISGNEDNVISGEIN